MILSELKEKAHSLPYAPGVYLMRDRDGQVIYVGKAKKLRNRVSQYFQDTASHTPKTRLMVSKVDSFEVIVAASEFEALVLECSLIKQHMPKYNILLKDDKGYPYIRLDEKAVYPTFSLAHKIENDGAMYFGPYGSRSVTQSIIDALHLILQLPRCGKKFPRDIGKDRPCLNFHMNQCAGWCRGVFGAEEYKNRILHAKQLLSGNYKQAADEVRRQMLSAAENMDFELAALLRDRLAAIEALGQKQLVIAGAVADTDVVGFAQTESKACFAVLHFSGGKLLDKDYEVISLPDDPENAVSSLLKQYYLNRGTVPKVVLLPFEVEDGVLFEQLLFERFKTRTKLAVPQRGDRAKMVELAVANALEEARRVTSKEEKHTATLTLLGKMLGVDRLNRLESFDISNISGTDIVAGMVVFESGKPKRSAYKRFKIDGLPGQDDYASIEQVVLRRFTHYAAGDRGFEELPDLLLIDGGATHAAVAERALKGLDLCVPVFGMVKDDRHRTRALVTSDGREIAIDGQQSVFAMIGSIQEETHRFAVSYHRKLRSKRLQYSQLDHIPGIGPKRKELLLKKYKSLTAISDASLAELEHLLPADAALAVYHHFRPETE